MIVREVKHSAARGEIDIINGVLAKSGYSAAIAKIRLREVRVADCHFNFTASSDAGGLDWTKPDGNIAAYDKLIVSQPHIILSADNKYKGLQPDQMVLLAYRLAASFTNRLGDALEIVDAPSEGAVLMNMAVTELVLKKKRGLLGYTLIGAVTHAATSNSKVNDLEGLGQKVQLHDANLEIE